MRCTARVFTACSRVKKNPRSSEATKSFWSHPFDKEHAASPPPTARNISCGGVEEGEIGVQRVISMRFVFKESTRVPKGLL